MNTRRWDSCPQQEAAYVTLPARTPLGSVAGLLVWILIGLFAVLSLFCVVAGAEVYKNAVENAEHNANTRTAVSYVTGKVRAMDAENAVAVEHATDGDRLMLYEDIEGESYVTCIYGWNGGIYEIFTPARGGFEPEEGQLIAEAEDFRLEMVRENLLRMEITEEDSSWAAHVALRSGRKA